MAAGDCLARPGHQVRKLDGRVVSRHSAEDRAASLPDFYAVLPSAAAVTLERAAGTDRLAAARLAERLSAGRAAPDATAALVVAGKPSWLVNSAAAQDLWLAVAGYAAEHARPRESGDAFALAADSPGPRSARARAPSRESS